MKATLSIIFKLINQMRIVFLLSVSIVAMNKAAKASPSFYKRMGLLQKRTNLQQPLSYVCMYRQNQEIAKTDEH